MCAALAFVAFVVFVASIETDDDEDDDLTEHHEVDFTVFGGGGSWDCDGCGCFLLCLVGCLVLLDDFADSWMRQEKRLELCNEKLETEGELPKDVFEGVLLLDLVDVSTLEVVLEVVLDAILISSDDFAGFFDGTTCHSSLTP